MSNIQSTKSRAALTTEDVYRVVGGYPNMSRKMGQTIHDFILDKGISSVLELGFNWGVSTCYMAAALQHQPDPALVSIDLSNRVAFKPSVTDFLTTLGLDQMAAIFYEHTTYNWRLRWFLRMSRPPGFDLVFIDGAHLWEPDALAFLLSERLLRPGGWIIFDDLNWTLAKSPFYGNKESTLAMPRDERETAHVREVFELLVRTHPNIAESFVSEPWAYARKKSSSSGAPLAPVATYMREIRRQASDQRALARARHPGVCRFDGAPRQQ